MGLTQLNKLANLKEILDYFYAEAVCVCTGGWYGRMGGWVHGRIGCTSVWLGCAGGQVYG